MLVEIIQEKTMSGPIEKSEDIFIDVKKLSLLEKVKFCERWEGSGLSKNAFCKKEGLKLPTFWRWYNQLRQNKAGDNGPLCEVKVVRPVQSNDINMADDIAVELNIMGKVDARLYLKEHQIRDLLMGLMNAATVVR